MISLLLAASLMGPPAPSPQLRDQTIEARFDEIKRVADGTFTDAAIIGAGSAFDIWATERCISRNPLCYEANPLGKDSGSQRIALKAGVYPLKVGISYFFRRTRHHRTARIFAVSFALLDGAIGVNNYRLSRKK